MVQTTQQLIDKFWSGTATDAEKQQLADALDQPGVDWQADLRRAFTQQDPTDGPLTDEQAKRVLLRLHRQIQEEPVADTSFTIWRNRVRWVAAAMLLLVGGLSVWLYTRATPQPVAQHATKSRWHLTNRTNRMAVPQTIQLADGSSLVLEPGSSVSYYEPFGRSARRISLTGEGLFSVAKDPAHPFTVLARGLTTTALGTRFRVRAVEANRVSVRLLEGRVMVRATAASGLSMPDTYLKPGQEFSINTTSSQLTVHRFAKEKPVAAAPSVTRPVSSPLPGLSFVKEPLNDVFDRISQRYNVQIEYESADVQGLSFSGSFAAADSLSVVLSAICLTNDLSFKQESGRITIVRSP